MVAKRSEYQNQFKSSVVKKNHDAYMANLALRHERRDREFMHTPLCWTEAGPEEEAVSSDISEEDILPPEENKKVETQEKEVYQSLAEIMSEAKEKAESLRRQRILAQNKPAEMPKAYVNSSDPNDDINKSVEKKEIADKSLSIYDIVDKENRKLNQKIAQAYVFDEKKEGKCLEGSDDEGKHSKNDKLEEIPHLSKEANLRKTFVKQRTSKKTNASRSYKPKASAGEKTSKAKASTPAPPVISTSVPSLSLTSLASRRPARPDRVSRASQNKCRPVSACSGQWSRPPFLSYGAADVEDSLSLHRTHNVLAPTDVYPLALRAKTRREEEQRRSREKRQNAKHCASAEDLLERLGSVGLTPREDWASEYSLQFHGYEPREYQRAISARSVIPRAASTSFMPVRSGGCRVVHVD
ncbi:hypothetical protein EGW08_005166 [Elysia chlorotica]|uniref:Uncharacterized protein n=1 Tax=Elysia chlorotica TaxID=188477 RepID=A0A3S1BFG4_ELYCH|nr:hypothetical protein EGW08_005166 [Elysia chlorotica]